MSTSVETLSLYAGWKKQTIFLKGLTNSTDGDNRNDHGFNVHFIIKPLSFLIKRMWNYHGVFVEFRDLSGAIIVQLYKFPRSCTKICTSF